MAVSLTIIFATFLTVIGSIAWILIFSFHKQKNNKCTYDIVKMTTSFTLAFGNFSFLIAFLHFNGVESLNTKWIYIPTALLVFSQTFNTILFFNIYSFAFEYRIPKIDPNLPPWLSWILGFLIPFGITISVLLLDKFLVIWDSEELIPEG